MSEDAAYSPKDVAREKILSWIERDPNFNPGDDKLVFGRLDIELEQGSLKAARPLYLFFGEHFVFLDAPFATVKEVPDVTEELGPWGIGKVGAAYTYHNVVDYGLVLAAPERFLYLMRTICSMAAKREFEITGKRYHLKDTGEKKLPESDAKVHSTQGAISSSEISTNVELSEIQQQALMQYMDELQIVVKRFRVSKNPISPAQAQLLATSKPDHLLSMVPDWNTPGDGPVRRVGFWLVPGFVAGCEDYYSTGYPIAEGEAFPYPYTDIRLWCSGCDGGGCEKCDESGEVIFDLHWDDSQRVFARSA